MGCPLICVRAAACCSASIWTTRCRATATASTIDHAAASPSCWDAYDDAGEAWIPVCKYDGPSFHEDATTRLWHAYARIHARLCCSCSIPIYHVRDAATANDATCTLGLPVNGCLIVMKSYNLLCGSPCADLHMYLLY